MNKTAYSTNDRNCLSLTADIVSAHVASNKVAAIDIPKMILSVFNALSGLGQSAEIEPVNPEPAVPIRSSIKHDYLVCLEDGAKLKTLKRYIRTHFDLSPDQYRAKWNLPRDYPMVAPAYAEKRRTLAIQFGLGRSKRAEAKVLNTTRENAGQQKRRGKPKPAL